MSLNIVLEGDLSLCVLEYAAILDLELKTENTNKQKFQAIIDTNNTDDIKKTLFELSGHFLKDFNNKAFEPSFNLYLQIFSLLNKDNKSNLETDLLKILDLEFKSSDLESSNVPAGNIISAITNVFNLLPESSIGRYQALDLISKLVLKNFPSSINSIAIGLKEWLTPIESITIEERSQLVSRVFIEYFKQNELQAYQFIKDITILELNNKANDIIVSEILNSKTYYDLEFLNDDSKFEISDLRKLVSIYVNLDYSKFQSNKSTFQSSLPTINLEQLGQLLQSLSLVEFFASSKEHVFSYAQLSSVLSIEECEVESVLFPLISQGVIKGKFSQLSNTFTVNQLSTSVVAKKNNEDTWNELDNQLADWSQNLSELDTLISDLINNAHKKKKTPPVIQRFHLAKQEAKKELEVEEA